MAGVLGGMGACIQDGDLAIVYERHDRLKAVTVRKGGELQNRFGVFSFDDWIGKPYGSRVHGKGGSGFIHVLAPTPQLWTLVLSHRTQILYIADISFVILGLELRPGCIVLESGTGSGSLTTSLARAVAPTGHVHSFDFHEARAVSAREDFERNRVSSVATVGVRDVQGDGFPEELTGKADGVFLDLPQPWLAVASVLNCLKPNSSCCSFSPCIEQVQRTCEALHKLKFADVRTFEVLLRSYEVRSECLGDVVSSDSAVVAAPPSKRKRGERNEEAEAAERIIVAKPYSETKGHTGFLTFARKPV